MSAAAIIALASLIGAPTPATASPDPKLVALVRKLGDKSYRTREDAARELLRRGADAVAALMEGTKDKDPEVAERCRQLLPQAAALERNEKLAALLKDPKAPPPKGLAGVERFLKITGDDKAARELYAEMIATHHRTLEAAEEEPRKAAEQYKQFCDDAYNRYYAASRTGRHSPDNLLSTKADATFLLFMSGDTRVRKHDTGVSRASVLFSAPQLTKAISEGDGGSPHMRKLFLDWLENESQPGMQQRGFMLATQVNLKEALPVALKVLEKPGQQTYGKAQVMISLAKLGSKEHIKALEPHLKDNTLITNINFGNGQMSIQMRDVAMGVCVQLAGQKISDFGFDTTRFGGGMPTSYYYYGFPVEADGKESKAREEAHAKWKEWAKKNLDKK